MRRMQSKLKINLLMKLKASAKVVVKRVAEKNSP